MKWLHLSDLHFGYTNNATNNLRKLMIDYITEISKENEYKYLFITGDICYGKAADIEKAYEEATQFIRIVAENAGIDMSNVYIVPGNHDAKRSVPRTAIINDIKRTYNANNGFFDNDSLTSVSTLSFDCYKKFYKRVCGRDYDPSPCFVLKNDDLNILHINTAFVSDKSSSDLGGIVFGMGYLDSCLEKCDTNKETIVIAHHGFEWIRSEEREKLELHLKRKNVKFYLCGHIHSSRIEVLDRMDHEKSVWQCLCATFMDKDEAGKPSDMGFLTGELSDNSQEAKIIDHRWSVSDEDWSTKSFDCSYLHNKDRQVFNSILPYKQEEFFWAKPVANNNDLEIEAKDSVPISSIMSELPYTHVNNKAYCIYLKKINSDKENTENGTAVPSYFEQVFTEIKKDQKKKKPKFQSEIININDKSVMSVCKELDIGVTYLIIGAGNIGSAICKRAIEYKPAKIVAIDINENLLYELYSDVSQEIPAGTTTEFIVKIANICDYSALDRIFNYYKPTYVILSAAYKNVPFCEDNIRSTVQVNICGALNVFSACVNHNVEKCIFVSTDKAENPTNLMGKTKHISELMAAYYNAISNHTKFSSIRFGNVLGATGSVIPLFNNQIKNGGPITITHPDIIRYFMTAEEISVLILDSLHLSIGGEQYVADMGDPVRILDLAETLIKLAGLQPHKDIKIVFAGLRPGEKLYEERIMSEVKLYRTQNSRLFHRHADNYDFKLIISQYNRIIHSLCMGKIEECISTIDELAAIK